MTMLSSPSPSNPQSRPQAQPVPTVDRPVPLPTDPERAHSLALEREPRDNNNNNNINIMCECEPPLAGSPHVCAVLRERQQINNVVSGQAQPMPVRTVRNELPSFDTLSGAMNSSSYQPEANWLT